MNNKKKMVLGGIAAAALFTPLAVGAAANAEVPDNLVANSSFEVSAASPSWTDGYVLVAAGEDYLTDWTVGAGGIDIVDNDLWQAHEGSRSVDLNALSGGSISQNLVTVPNQVYNVSFWMSGNPDTPLGEKTMNVTADGTQPQVFTFDTTNTTASAMGWQQKSYTFTATDVSTTLTFTSTTTTGTPSFAGPVIDDVVVTAAADSVTTRVWYTWTGGNVATAPTADDANWHPTKGDPQSSLHRYQNHTAGTPYYVANNGPKGGGSWFLWK